MYETKCFVQKELDILGSRNALGEDFRDVIRMLEKGDFPVNETITLTVAFEDVNKALEEWDNSPPAFTKSQVDMRI